MDVVQQLEISAHPTALLAGPIQRSALLSTAAWDRLPACPQLGSRLAFRARGPAAALMHVMGSPRPPCSGVRATVTAAQRQAILARRRPAA